MLLLYRYQLSRILLLFTYELTEILKEFLKLIDSLLVQLHFLSIICFTLCRKV